MPERSSSFHVRQRWSFPSHGFVQPLHYPISYACNFLRGWPSSKKPTASAHESSFSKRLTKISIQSLEPKEGARAQWRLREQNHSCSVYHCITVTYWRQKVNMWGPLSEISMLGFCFGQFDWFGWRACSMATDISCFHSCFLFVSDRLERVGNLGPIWIGSAMNWLAGPTSLWKKYEVMISYAEQEHFALVSRQSCDTKAKTLRPQPEWQVRCIRSSVNPLMLCNRAAQRGMRAWLGVWLDYFWLLPCYLFWLQKDQLCFGAAFLHDGLMEGWIDG